jgi:hypothetical protein
MPGEVSEDIVDMPCMIVSPDLPYFFLTRAVKVSEPLKKCSLSMMRAGIDPVVHISVVENEKRIREVLMEFSEIAICLYDPVICEIKYVAEGGKTLGILPETALAKRCVDLQCQVAPVSVLPVARTNSGSDHQFVDGSGRALVEADKKDLFVGFATLGEIVGHQCRGGSNDRHQSSVSSSAKAVGRAARWGIRKSWPNGFEMMTRLGYCQRRLQNETFRVGHRCRVLPTR